MITGEAFYAKKKSVTYQLNLKSNTKLLARIYQRKVGNLLLRQFYLNSLLKIKIYQNSNIN